MANDSVLLDISGHGVATLTLNRPDVYNAFDDRMIGDLHARLDEIQNRDDLRAVLLRGEGKHFCAGADADWMRRAAGYKRQQNLEDANNLGQMLKALDRLPHPTIALVNGAAMGGGVGIVACCDIAISEEHSFFALSEVRLGLIPATVAPYVLNAIGSRAARRYFLTGERLDPAEARRIGLIHQIVADKDALSHAGLATVENLLASAPGAVRNAKRAIRELYGRPIDDELISKTAEMIADQRSSDEGREGLSAFLEKRKPDWFESNE